MLVCFRSEINKYPSCYDLPGNFSFQKKKSYIYINYILKNTSRGKKLDKGCSPNIIIKLIKTLHRDKIYFDLLIDISVCIQEYPFWLFASLARRGILTFVTVHN